MEVFGECCDSKFTPHHQANPCLSCLDSPCVTLQSFKSLTHSFMYVNPSSKVVTIARVEFQSKQVDYLGLESEWEESKRTNLLSDIQQSSHMWILRFKKKDIYISPCFLLLLLLIFNFLEKVTYILMCKVTRFDEIRCAVPLNSKSTFNLN